MAFITQRGEKVADATIKGSHIGELEALVSGVNQISQSTLLLKKMKEMHEVDDSLDYMKEQYKNRMEACDERQREFERRQAEMKDQVTKFEKFIQENDSKRQRAEMKMRQERSLYRQKSREHEKLREDLARVSAERDALIEQLKDLQKYESYLEDVVHLEGDSSFEETWDLLNRHKTLKSANADLMQQVSKKERAGAWDGGWSGLRRRRRRRRRQLQLLLLIIIMTIVAR
jgi:chromosome segregation ATPase